MKILVTGAGRGGTNLVTELIRSMKIVTFTPQVEDRSFFNSSILSNNYGTKLAIGNKGFNILNIKRMMDSNTDLFVVFSLRHPIDNVLSKIVRGQPQSKGGDSTVEERAPDGTVDGAVNSILEVYRIYLFLQENYSDRLLVVKMEDLILEPKETVEDVCDYFNVGFTDDMLNFHQHNRNNYQKRRYGNNLVKNVELYTDLNNNFDGYFKNNNGILEQLNDSLKDVIIGLDYKQIK